MAIDGIDVIDGGCCCLQATQLHIWHEDIVCSCQQELLLSTQMLVCLDLKALPLMPVLSVQVLELPADICDTVELQYRPPGHISAGLTCQITIIFTPKVWPAWTVSTMHAFVPSAAIPALIALHAGTPDTCLLSWPAASKLEKKEKKRQKTILFGVNSMRTQVIHQAA